MKETKFKQTEVGLIPCDWNVKTVKCIAPLQRGFDLPTAMLRDGNVPVVYSNGICNFHNKSKCIGPGLVTGRSGTIGKFTFIASGPYWPHNTSLWVTSFKGNNPLFVYYLYSSLKIEDFSGGSGVPTLNRNNVHEKMVAVPSSIEEQKRIAQALSDVDSVISTTEKLIAKKRALKQGAMQTLLSGKMRIQNGKWIETTNFKQTELGPIPQEWEVKSFGSITQNSSYGVGAEAIPFNGKAKYIRITDIDDDSHRFEPSPLTSPAFYENKHLVQENDLLIARTGASVGKTYLYNAKDGKLVFAGFLIKMNICGADSKFVFYSTLTKYYQDWIVSESARTGQPGVNLQQMKKLLIAIPSSMAEQTAIATILSDMDSEIAALETKLAKYRQLKTGMMQQLLTGKIRLV